MKKMVVLTGAGISAESGFATFRDSGGLWETYNVQDVASPEGWARDRALVSRFYNDRRVQLGTAKPNRGHLVLAEMEDDYDIHIITQNVDNLHERAGSSKVLHLHGELTKVESCNNPSLVYDIGYRALKDDERAEDGGILRPHIVWFGEAVLAIEEALRLTRSADIFVVIGTSLAVYPAAGLIDYVPATTPIFLVDPNKPDRGLNLCNKYFQEPATVGVPMLYDYLRAQGI